MIVRGRLLLPHLGDLDLARSRRHVAARLYTPGARSRGVGSSSGAAASRFRPQEEAAGRNDTLAGLESREHLDRVAEDRTELHRTFRETGVVALHRHVDDTAVTDRLHRVARHERHALARRRLSAPAPSLRRRRARRPSVPRYPRARDRGAGAAGAPPPLPSRGPCGWPRPPPAPGGSPHRASRVSPSARASGDPPAAWPASTGTSFALRPAPR